MTKRELIDILNSLPIKDTSPVVFGANSGQANGDELIDVDCLGDDDPDGGRAYLYFTDHERTPKIVTRYRVTAETPTDFIRFVSAAFERGIYVADFFLPPGPQMDYDITFESTATLAQVREIMRGLTDCEKMAETLERRT